MSELEKNLGYSFKQPDLLKRAMIHKSLAHETRSGQTFGDNEKLEFLGDAVLDLILSELLMDLFPADAEGQLSKKRAGLVNEATLCEVARKLELAKFLRLGKGETMTGGAQKPRLLSSAFEALVGALFLDAGFDRTREIVRGQMKPLIAAMDPLGDFSLDFKTKLQEEVQALFKEAPVYQLTGETGPSHDPVFEVEVFVQNRSFGKASGRTKKTAEQAAAQQALEQWKNGRGGLT